MLKHLVVALRHRTGNDEWCTGIVDKHRVNLVDNGKVVGALHKVFGRSGHVVAQIVETKLVVRTESDVGVIGFAALRRVRLSLVDASHRQAVEHIQRTHPFRVALSQIVVHGYDVHTVAGEGVEEHRQGCHKGFTFTGCHFGNLALVEHHAANELAIVVNHIPHHAVAAGNPIILIYCFVAFNCDEIVALGSQIAVEVGGGHLNGFVLGETAGGVLNHGKHFGDGSSKPVFQYVENFLLKLVDAVPQRFAILVVGFFNFLFQLGYFGFLASHALLQAAAHFIDARTQFIVRQFLNLGINSLDFVNHRHEFL